MASSIEMCPPGSSHVLAVCSLPTHHCPRTIAHLCCCAAFRNDFERIKASLGLPKYTVGQACYPYPNQERTLPIPE